MNYFKLFKFSNVLEFSIHLCVITNLILLSSENLLSIT